MVSFRLISSKLKLLPPRIKPDTPLRARLFSSSAFRSDTLVFIEHKSGKINSATLSAMNAAKQIGTPITAIITGSSKTEGIKEAIEIAKKLPIEKLLIKEHDSLEHYLVEPIAPLISNVMKKYEFTHLIGGQSSVTKNIFPRISSILDIYQVSDVLKIIDPNTFIRPIYAGNALLSLKSEEPIKILTIRTASFEPIQIDSQASGSVKVEILDESLEVGQMKTKWVSENLNQSERPELGTSKRIVSGGRGLKNKENFETLIIPLADKLQSAIGASRAAVDSGFVDNSLQIGQTGKVVSPDLYLAVGISGAIQHLAGMKDSKTIVAINKDPEAPIFQVADIGLVGDLFEVVPFESSS